MSWTKEIKTPHKCPVCDGTGKVSRPPNIPGDVQEWSGAGSGPYPCKACESSCIVWDIQLIPMSNREDANGNPLSVSALDELIKQGIMERGPNDY